MEPTTFELVTFGIAVAGFALAVTGLGWQMLSWTWAGSRVKVETRLSSVHVPQDGGPRWVDIVEVIARNKGRTAVDVMAWYVIYDRSKDLVFGYFEWEPWQGPEVPVRLEAGQAQSWRISTNQLATGLREHDLSLDRTNLRGQVLLGTGQRKRSRNAVTILPIGHGS